MAARAALSYDDYTVGWICALPLEMAAAQLMMDTIHPTLPSPSIDHNTYTLGNIGEHNIVIACLPSGAPGNVSAATVAMQLRSTFQSIRFGLMVGIGGGIPSGKADIRLGDIVVSQPRDTSGGVIQYDLGRALHGGQFQRTGMLNRPPKVLLTALAALQAHHLIEDSQVTDLISSISAKIPSHKAAKFAYPSQEDCLYKAEYQHNTGDTCANCDQSELAHRSPRDHTEPVIHYGLIASANQVVKDGRLRDQIAQELGIYCVEMEAAGLVNDFPCLVIRGISDYADSHKNNDWQGYAAAAAAAYTKELLLLTPIDLVITSKPSSGTPQADTSETSCSTSSPGLVNKAQEDDTASQPDWDSSELEREFSDDFERGCSLHRQEQYREAERVLRYTLLGQEELLGHDHESVRISAYWLGRSLFDQARYEEAETMFHRAIKGPEIYTGEHDSGDFSFTLACCLYRQKRYREAENIFREFHEMHMDAYALGCVVSFEPTRWLGCCLYRQGRHTEAEDAFRRALEMQEITVGHDHEDTLDAAHWLGRSLLDQDRYQEAEAMFRRTLQGREKVLGHDHKHTVECAYWLGRSLILQGRQKEAEGIFQRVLQAREKTLGHDHEDTLDAVHWLGRSLCDQGRYKESEAILRRALRGREKALGYKHEDTLSSRHWLGISLCYPNRYNDATLIFRQTLRARQKVIGHDHEDTLLSIHWIGVSLYRQNRYKEAEPIFRQAVLGREKVLGSDHRETLCSRKYANKAHERALSSK